MLQAVVVGIGGVVAAWDAVAAAEVAAAAAWLATRGFDPDHFAAAARRRHGEPSWLARALAEAGLVLEPGARRALVVTTRGAAPSAVPTPHRAALTALGRSHLLAALDSGPGPRLDAWTRDLGLDDVFRHRLWTDDLGAAGRPPRATPFRFMTRRLGTRAPDCLYVAGHAGLAAAARSAGWRVVCLPAPAAPGFDWDACIAGAAGDA